MKRNINEIYETLKKKMESAQNDMMYERNRQYPSHKKVVRLEGEIEAYQEAIVLIETSDILNKEVK